jgi:hypothetical protein
VATSVDGDSGKRQDDGPDMRTDTTQLLERLDRPYHTSRNTQEPYWLASENGWKAEVLNRQLGEAAETAMILRCRENHPRRAGNTLAEIFDRWGVGTRSRCGKIELPQVEQIKTDGFVLSYFVNQERNGFRRIVAGTYASGYDRNANTI